MQSNSNAIKAFLPVTFAACEARLDGQEESRLQIGIHSLIDGECKKTIYCDEWSNPNFVGKVIELACIRHSPMFYVIPSDNQ